MGRSHRYLLVGWLWFLGALVPMIGLVHVGNQAMADRYAYLPFIGLFLMVCWGVSELAERRHVPVIALRSAGMIVLLVLAVVTHHQLAYWNDNVTLWTHAIEASTDNYVAHDNLALLLIDRGQTEEAMKHFQAALAIYPVRPHQQSPDRRVRPPAWEVAGSHCALRSDDQASRRMVRAGRNCSATKGWSISIFATTPQRRRASTRQLRWILSNYRGWLGLGVLAFRSGDLNLAIDDLKRSNCGQANRGGL